MISIISAVLILPAAPFLGACATSVDGPREFTVPAGQYAQAFDATREALRDLDFDLDRVDAAAGVITTRPHFSQGLFQLADGTQTTASDEWEDAMNTQAREVRVTFVPVAPAGESGPPTDLRGVEGELRGSVRVTLFRQQRVGRRLDSEWITGSTFYTDPILEARTGSRYLVPIRRDEELESRLASVIGGAASPPEEQASSE